MWDPTAITDPKYPRVLLRLPYQVGSSNGKLMAQDLELRLRKYYPEWGTDLRIKEGAQNYTLVFSGRRTIQTVREVRETAVTFAREWLERRARTYPVDVLKDVIGPLQDDPLRGTAVYPDKPLP